MDTHEGFPRNWSPQLLSVLRIVAALLFLTHGTAKLFHAPHQANFDDLQLMSLMGVQGLIEVIGGVLLAIGLFSRIAAFVMSGDMHEHLGQLIAYARSVGVKPPWSK